MILIKLMHKLAILGLPRERLFLFSVEKPQEATETASGCGFRWAWEPAKNTITLFLRP
jgi:hypothetical protein